MKKFIIAICGFIIGAGALTAHGQLRILTPDQGGTGLGSATAADVDKCLKVADDSPFRFILSTCGIGNAKWATSTTDSTAIHTAGATKVGIGSTTPWAQLSVHRNTSNTSYSPLFVVASSTASATTTNFIVANNGNVGIGTNNPSALLDVSGTTFNVIRASNTTGNTQITANAPSGSYGYLRLNAGTTFWDIAERDTEYSGALQFRFNALTPQMVIQTGGNVGIGNTSPGVLLSVLGTAGSNNALGDLIEIRKQTGSTPVAGLGGALVFNTQDSGFTNINTGRIGSIATDVTPGAVKGALVFQTKGSGSLTLGERMRIDDAGNVGIGTTTPGSILVAQSATVPQVKVAGSASGLGTYFIAEGITPGGGAEAGFIIRRGQALTSVQDRWKMMGGGSENSTDNGAGSDLYIQSQVNNGGWVDRLFINRSSGNVGIGTTTPPSKVTIGVTSAELASANPVLLLGTSTLTSASANGTYIGVNAPTNFAGNFIQYQVNGTTRFRAGPDGNIGFADGANTAGNLSVYFINDTDTGWYRPGANEIQFVAGGAERLGIISQGLKLNTTGTAALPDFFYNGDTNTGVYHPSADEIGLSTNGTSRLYIGTTGLVGISSTTPWGLLSVNANGLSAGVPQFVVGSSTATNFIVTNSGNVGIGTTNPAIGASSAIQYLTVSKSTGSAIELQRLTASTNTDIGYLDFFNGTTRVGEIGYVGDGATDSGYFNLYTKATGASLTEKLRVTGAGNVGIGTSTPAGKLHVTSGASATTTANFGTLGDTTSKSCFNTKNTAGADISFYFVGTSMVIENNQCR